MHIYFVINVSHIFNLSYKELLIYILKKLLQGHIGCNCPIRVLLIEQPRISYYIYFIAKTTEKTKQQN